MLNGDGLRVVLWLAGCTHHCKNCQNPITWDPNGGIPFDEDAKQEVFEELEKDYVDGITFSGGDPLLEQNREELTGLIREIRSLFPEKTIWLYTGYLWEEISDLELIDDLNLFSQLENGTRTPRNLPWKGSANQRVIDVQMTRKLGKVVLYA